MALSGWGCTTAPSAPLTLNDGYPAELLRYCAEMTEAASDDPNVVLNNHASNMLEAGLCRSRHNQLVDIIKSRGQ